jgi:hypothetical protein
MPALNNFINALKQFLQFLQQPELTGRLCTT